MMEKRTRSLEHGDAACTLYWDAPKWDGRPTLAVGAFRCGSSAAGAALLREACECAQSRGMARIIGPMDGDTWHRYRVVTYSDGTPPFLLEPQSGEHDQAAFLEAGFGEISQYVSARVALAATIGEPQQPVPGVQIAPWNGDDPSKLIEQLFELSSQSFSENAFFKPITRESFLELYAPVIPAVDPELMLFARSGNGELVGFLFGLKNTTGDAEDRKPTAIVKTYASRVRGCGHWLLDTFHRKALDLGYRDVIHALMHVDNDSIDRSARHGTQVFRRYELMGRDLEQVPGRT